MKKAQAWACLANAMILHWPAQQRKLLLFITWAILYFLQKLCQNKLAFIDINCLQVLDSLFPSNGHPENLTQNGEQGSCVNLGCCLFPHKKTTHLNQHHNYLKKELQHKFSRKRSSFHYEFCILRTSSLKLVVYKYLHKPLLQEMTGCGT